MTAHVHPEISPCSNPPSGWRFCSCETQGLASAQESEPAPQLICLAHDLQTGFKHPVVPERIWKWGHTSPCFCCAPPFQFLALQVQLVVSVSNFMMVSTVWSVFCLLFFHSWCPPCPAICKSWGACTPLPSPYGVGATANISQKFLTKSSKSWKNTLVRLSTTTPSLNSMRHVKMQLLQNTVVHRDINGMMRNTDSSKSTLLNRREAVQQCSPFAFWHKTDKIYSRNCRQQFWKVRCHW